METLLLLFFYVTNVASLTVVPAPALVYMAQCKNFCINIFLKECGLWKGRLQAAGVVQLEGTILSTVFDYGGSNDS